MASDLAKLFLLASRYQAEPDVYHSRVVAYDIKSDEYIGFISMLMNADACEGQLQGLSRNLKKPVDSLLQAGVHLINNGLFSKQRNYYQFLGLQRDASNTAIRNRFRQLIPLFHPDRCDMADVDCEFISAQINQAYTTLKREKDRQAYDETLSLSLRVNPGARSSNGHVRSTSTSNGNKPRQRSSFLDLLLDLPLMHSHPKTAVWGLLAVVLLMFVFLYGRDADRLTNPPLVGAKPVAKLQHEAPEPVPRPVYPAVDEQLSSDYLRESIQSPKLSSMLEPVEKSEVGGQDGQQSVRITTDVVTQAGPTVVQQPAHAAGMDDSQITGFDGGPPVEQDSVDKLLSRSRNMNVDQLLNTYQSNPEQVMMRFVKGYESGDISEFSRLFVNNVRTNHGRGRQELLDRFSRLFDTTSSRKINIKQLKIKPQNMHEALVFSDIEASLLRDNEASLRHYNGEIIFRLVDSNAGMQIAEMLHNVH